MAVEINNKAKNKVNPSFVKKVAEKFLRAYKKTDYSISIAFVGDKEIRKLNKKYRRVDRVTDILSFAGEEKFLGEIILDYHQIKRQADKFGNKSKDELIFILVHGLLHLLGYDDKTEAGRKKMERLGNEFIKSIK
ncbi:MAG: rRNA maturation RNase YbeY [Patescibacteria group bacterium]|nr:rRNA maturation RNase YbeY [Patescibacteria group bacterium]MDD5554476.1 rRNA maturation RNase YbeY [Patescibacteria group bacterium]